MSTLTKLFIVILVVLVLIAVPVFISQSAVPTNYKALYEGEQTRARIAEAGQANQQLAAESYRNLYNGEASLRAADNATHQAEVADKTRQITQLSLAIGKYDDRMKELNTSIDSLKVTVADAQNLNKNLTTKLEEARAERDKIAGQLNSQVAALTSLQNERDMLQKNVDALKEMNVTVQTELKDLQKQIESGGAPKKAATPQPNVKLDGSVTAVDRGVAQINLGSTSGVKKGMMFFVYRNTDFVARLQIEEVDAGQAAGVVSDAKRDIRQGDKVTTSLE